MKMKIKRQSIQQESEGAKTTPIGFIPDENIFDYHGHWTRRL